ncbi:sugar transferase [Chondromyces crocatus]|uniref:UDP-galactose phosphate transferase n=1 Tax=Chondromyces crocatus TaxID=52 RepID=A0A0K1EAK2_CHOCO|nr:sugar transferase [Chondromyces crocatus]AKT37588.1 UDP-galactose phosphate transferase [Chondromyces crocatus]
MKREKPSEDQGARWVKRALDVSVAGLALAGTLPLMAVTAALIALEDGRPVLFVQRRVGRGGRLFDMLKFRTMRENSLTIQQTGQVRGDHPLVTRVGRVIRRYKLDELPQLVNVLRGDMSLVGPRPTYPEHAATFTSLQQRRLEVLPGCTGWAQVNGGTLYTWDERILMDVWYVDHWSLGLDLRILLRTVGVILGGEREGGEVLQRARDHATHLERERSEVRVNGSPAHVNGTSVRMNGVPVRG